jgi:biotin-dependent carboxylase-like uncharacterized protein
MFEPIQLFFQKAGLQTSLQDLGRWGQQHLGIPVGGAMDIEAAKKANYLVGNPVDTPLLEITLMGPSIDIKGTAQIALTGANLSPMINGEKAPMYESIQLEKKTNLSFGRLKKGCRAYLAIGGDWKVQKCLSSCSPILSGESFLLPQNIIRAKDSMVIHPKKFVKKRRVSKKLRPIYSTHLELRTFPGPEFEAFSRCSIAAFFSRQHIISNQSNRMGYRLKSRLPDFQPSKELISSGIVPGTVQISNAGQAILLMKDAPTTGGYYRLANVHSEDLDALAQLKPGDSVSFRLEV